MAVLCVGLFSDRQQANAAVEELRQRGIGSEDISAVLAGRQAFRDLHKWEEQHHLTTHGGDVKRLGLAWLAFEAGSLTLPIAGYVIALGGLVAGVIGALAGFAMAVEHRGIAGALTDLGMSAEEARYHEQRVAKGACLVVVDCAQCSSDEVREVLLRYGAEDRSQRVRSAAGPAQAGATG